MSRSQFSYSSGVKSSYFTYEESEQSKKTNVFYQREVAIHGWSLYRYNSLRAELRACEGNRTHKLHVLKEQIAVLREAARRHGVAAAADQYHV